MGFWIFMFFMALLIPVTMLLIGLLFMKRPPGRINSFYGYKTPMSTKNQDTWLFAHLYCGRIWFWSGIAMLPITFIVMIMTIGKDIDRIGMAGGKLTLLQCGVMVLSILPTEIALKRRFDKYGNFKY